METFTLTAEQKIINDNQVHLCLYPTHTYLFDKIEHYELLDSSLDINTQISDLITLHTPLLFYKVLDMENVPQNVKDNIQL